MPYVLSTSQRVSNADNFKYKTLLDMKQKQANVDEMWLARQSTTVAAEQGRAIMFFTIFTIVFVR